MNDLILQILLDHYPRAQAVYLFGSHGTAMERPDSDVDIALLLPHQEAEEAGSLRLAPCAQALALQLNKCVDLVNLRRVSTVFQHEIIHHSRMLHIADAYAHEEFEMLVMSYYQKLNEERADIIESFRKTGKAYRV